MKYNITLFIIIFLSIHSFGQHDHDHDHGAVETVEAPEVKTSESSSERYEILAKYEHLHPKENGQIDIYVSDFHTNRPLNVKLTFSNPKDKNQKFEVKSKELGVYTLTTTFADTSHATLDVNIDGNNGLDQQHLDDIIVSAEEAGEEAHDHSGFLHQIMHYWQYILAFLLFVVGIWLGRWYQKGKTINGKTLSIILLAMFASVPLDNVVGHGDDGSNPSLPSQSGVFDVPKETQFLFDIVTEKSDMGNFQGNVLLYGTIIPSNSGSAIITSPQSGKITSLFTKPGDKVAKGQKLATIATFIDVNTQVAIESNKISVIEIEAQRNDLEAELEAAQKENDRLSRISDIAAKKDIDEAISRLTKARSNLNLFNKTATRGDLGKLDKNITIYAPISGTVSEFLLSTGSTVTMGQQLFSLTNTERVFIEGQIYDRDISKLNKSTRYEAQCVSEDHRAAVNLISTSNMVNTENQSQKVLFELDNKKREFKIGEFVNVRLFNKSDTKGIVLPNSAISEINGKPVIFVKESAEKYYPQYVNLGENNGSHTLINKGLDNKVRVVVNGAYQIKMMYLNQ